MEPFMDAPIVVGSKNYVSKPWHTAGGARYFRAGGVIPPHGQNIADYRGRPQMTKYVANVLAGLDGKIPRMEGNAAGCDADEEYDGPSYFVTNGLMGGVKEGFWYNMNRLEDSNWYSGKLDDEFKAMLNNENKERDNLIKSNIDSKIWKRVPGSVKAPTGLLQSSQNYSDRLGNWYSNNVPMKSEGFGNNRSHEYWNEKDYPMVTTNDIDVTKLFPQSGSAMDSMYKWPMTRKLWGEYDRLRPDNPIINARNKEIESSSGSISSHIEKNS
jgi:hypothetical protein